MAFPSILAASKEQDGIVGGVPALFGLMMQHQASLPEQSPEQLGPTNELCTGMRFTESPRWHDGKLWFVDMHSQTVYSMAKGAEPQVEVKIDDDVVSGLGWDRDGLLNIVSMGKRKLVRREKDGSISTVADVGDIATWLANDMVMDEAGRAYIGNFGFDIYAEKMFPVACRLALVTPDGKAVPQGEDLGFPNGMVITPDGKTLIVGETLNGRLSAFDRDPESGLLTNQRVWAHARNAIPDGICLDSAGGVWIASLLPGQGALRIEEGGKITHQVSIPENLTSFAVMLGGEDGDTLFICVSTTSEPNLTVDQRSAGVRAAKVPFKRAGMP